MTTALIAKFLMGVMGVGTVSGVLAGQVINHVNHLRDTQKNRTGDNNVPANQSPTQNSNSSASSH